MKAVGQMEQDLAPKPACFDQVPLWAECLLRRSFPSFLATRYTSFHVHGPRGTGSMMPAGTAWGSRVSPSPLALRELNAQTSFGLAWRFPNSSTREFYCAELEA